MDTYIYIFFWVQHCESASSLCAVESVESVLGVLCVLFVLFVLHVLAIPSGQSTSTTLASFIVSWHVMCLLATAMATSPTLGHFSLDDYVVLYMHYCNCNALSMILASTKQPFCCCYSCSWSVLVDDPRVLMDVDGSSAFLLNHETHAKVLHQGVPARVWYGWRWGFGILPSTIRCSLPLFNSYITVRCRFQVSFTIQLYELVPQSKPVKFLTIILKITLLEIC